MNKPQTFKVLERWPVLLATADRDRLDVGRVVLQPGDVKLLCDPDTIASGLAGGKIEVVTADPPAIEVSAADIPSPRVELAGDSLSVASPAAEPSVQVEITEEPAKPSRPAAKKPPPGRKPKRGRRRG